MNSTAQGFAHLSPDEKRSLLEKLIARQSSKTREEPASSTQERLWYLDHLVPGSTVYSQTGVLELTAMAIDTSVLTNALNSVVSRHETLRTTFSTVDGRAVQRIAGSLELKIYLVDLSERPATEREAEVGRLATEQWRAPFDLAKGPLLRMTLLRLQSDAHVLVFTIHHIIADGWSASVLIREVVAEYLSQLAGQKPQLPKLTAQYTDFVQWEQGFSEQAGYQDQLDYWRGKLAGVRLSPLPYDFPRPQRQSFRGATRHFVLSERVSRLLPTFCRSEGVTPFMALLTAFQILLSRYTGESEAIVGSPTAGRSRPEFAPLIGFFVNMLTLRTNLSGDPAVRQLLQRVRKVCLDAYANEQIPFANLVQELEVDREVGHQPLFNVGFALHPNPAEQIEVPGLGVRLIDIDPETSKNDLTLFLWEGRQALTASLEYSTDLFAPATIERMVEHFQNVLAAILGDPAQLLSAITMLSEAERQSLADLSTPRLPDARDEPGLIQRFARAAAEAPDATAVYSVDGSLSYAELDEASSRLAAHLSKQGMRPGSSVALWLKTSPDLIIGLLAVLKTGAVYVPLDEDSPPAYLARVFKTAALEWVLTSKDLEQSLPPTPAQVVCLNAEANATDIVPPSFVAAEAKPSDPAYTLGDPRRGVVVTHGRLTQRLDWLQRECALTAADAVSHRSSGPDRWIIEILWPLANGAAVCLEPAAGDALGDATQRPATIACLTPYELASLVEQPDRSERLRVVLCSGGHLRQEVVDALCQRFPECRLYNLYGPPEAGGEVTAHLCQPGQNREIASIGRPTSLPVFVLDGHGQPAPLGVYGEIHIGGHVDGGDGSVQLLATGDRGRRFEDGSIELAASPPGRAWVDGSKTDLPLVVDALLEDPAVDDCAVLVRMQEQQVPALVAYVVGPSPLDVDRLRESLGQRLPKRLLPQACVVVTSLPLSADGRLDVAALSQLEVVEESLMRPWEDRLRAEDLIEEVAVVAEEAAPAHRTALHLTDLLDPQLLDDNSTSKADPTETEPTARTNGVPAVAHGETLREVPGEPTNLTESLARAAQGSNGIVHIDAEGHEQFETYSELLADAEQMLAGLRAQAARPGDAVLLQLPASRDFLGAYWACVLGGFIPVPLSVPATYDPSQAAVAKLVNAWRMLDDPLIVACESATSEIRQLGGQLELGDLRVSAVENLRAHARDNDWHAAQPDDLAIVLLTSGSTGKPKGVALSHANLLGMIKAVTQQFAFTHEDVSLNWMPLDHVGGIAMFHIRCVHLGSKQVHAPTQRVVEDPLRWLDWIDQYGATITWAPNFAFALVNQRAADIAKRSWDLSSMQFIVNAGENVVVSTARRFLELLEPHGLPAGAMRPAFGMSETCSGITHALDFNLGSTSDDDRFVSVGRPIPGTSVRIVDEQNQVVGAGDEGRLQLRGVSLTRGYYQNPDLNAEVFHDGWFQTGDLGKIEGGQLTITGREKDVIIINGVNFPCHEIEACVEQLDGVEISCTAACAVRVGTNTDRLAVFFVPSAGLDPLPLELIKQIRQELARRVGIAADYIVPVDSSAIPKTGIGKIQRSLLSQRFEAGAFADVAKRLDILAANERTIPDWFFRETWRRCTAGTAQHDVEPAIVFAGESRLCEQITAALPNAVIVTPAEKYEQLAGNRYCIDPTHAEHYDRLLGTVEREHAGCCRRVLHLWSCEPETASKPDRLEAARRRGALSLLLLAQALARANEAQRNVSLDVVSVHAHAIAMHGSEQHPESAHSELPALVKVLDQEIPWLQTRHIDLEFGADDAEQARPLLDELTARTSEREVAYRGGQRLVHRLQQIDLARSQRQPLPFSDGGMYVISGGLGDIGRELARFLLERFEARLLLLGRTSLEDSEELAERLQELQGAGGTVKYVALDAADSQRLEEEVTRAEAEWLCSLDGVIHLAALGHENNLLDETPDSFRAAAAAKTEGTLAIGALLKRRPGTLFLGFSSVNSFFGGAQTGAYSASNRFLEDYCRRRLARGEARTYCFAWSMWDEVGLSRGYALKQASQARGFGAVSVRQGLASLWAALCSRQHEAVIGLEPTNRHIRRWSDSNDCRLVKLCAYFTSPSDAVEPSALATDSIHDRYGRLSHCDFVQLEELPRTQDGQVDVQLLSTRARRSSHDSTQPRNERESQLQRIWQEILGISSIGIHDNFFELGGHSLAAVQLMNKIQEQFGKPLPLPVLAEGPTIAALAERLDDTSIQIAPASGCLVPLRATGSRPPFFCIHQLGGLALGYNELAKHLGDDQPVYGVQSAGLYGERVPLTTIEEMAALYIDAIRTVVPHGPYYLGGHSLGGLLAFEMAQQLHEQDETVALLAVMDTPVVGLDDEDEIDSLFDIESRFVLELIHGIERFSGAELAIGEDDLRGLSSREQLERLHGGLERLDAQSKSKGSNTAADAGGEALVASLAAGGLPLLQNLATITSLNYESSKQYRPRTSSQHVTLFQSTELHADESANVKRAKQQATYAMGWDRVATVEIHQVPGDHFSMIQEPNVRQLAALLQDCIVRSSNDAAARLR